MTRKAKRMLAKFMALVMAVTVLSFTGGFSSMQSSVVYGVAAWNSETIYTGGDEVEYNGAIYKCKWWTKGDTPSNGGPWELVSGSTPGGDTGDLGSLKPGKATVTLDPQIGTNVNGVTLPSNYYNKKVVGYFPSYAITSQAHEYFNIADLQWDKLTHIQYAFGIVNKDTCELEVGDPEHDIESKFEGTTFKHDGQVIKMDDSLGYYGQFNIMHTLKKMHPDVTVLISTGGWGASEGLWYATQNEASMRKFSASAVSFIRKYGFDGIDIDFEFPSETPQSGNYTDFTESIRSGIADRYAQFIKILSEDLAKASKEDGTYYWLTSAVAASSWVLGGQTNSAFLDYLDFVSVMSYDFHGGWNNYVENQANLYADPADTETAQVDVKTLGFDWAYRFYRGKVQSEKILMGVPYYTRGWTNVSGGTNGLHGSSGTPLTNSVDNLNLWCDLDENGKEVAAGANPLWHVMNLMKSNSNYKRYWDDVGKVPHIWNAQNNTFLTFEDTESVQERINYVNNNNLGGVLIWVMHGDYDYDEQQQKYVIGDTLTSMFHDQFKAKGASKVSSDVDYTNDTLNFSVDFGGKYDHPNYTYTIKLTNNESVAFPAGYTLSFDLPKSSKFTSAWGATATTEDKGDFTTVTLTSTGALSPGESVEFTGMLKCCFSGVKNFKVNGYSMLSEVNNEITRLNRAYLTDKNGGSSEIPTEPETEAPTEKPTEVPTQTPTEKPTEAPTQAPTTKPDTKVQTSVKGYQISTTVEGYRVLYNVSDSDNEVVKAGLIYGLSDKATENEMVVGSGNQAVYDYAATNAGLLSKSGDTSLYAMTMEFVKTKEFYQAGIMVRPYVQLKNGEYVYGEVESLKVYDIADSLYQKELMPNEAAHSYLYNNILKVTDSSYTEKPFNYKNILVK